MKKLPLSEKMLELIIMVQTFAELMRYEQRYHNLKDDNWFKLTEDYYNCLEHATNSMSKLGLHTNRHDFERVINFNVTKEIANTEFKDLHNFSL